MIEEIENAIQNINNDLYQYVEDAENIMLVSVSTGYSIAVEFLGIVIFNTEDDERPDTDQDGLEIPRQPIEEYLRLQVMIEIKRVSVIQLVSDDAKS
jgi:hypothetical protein